MKRSIMRLLGISICLFITTSVFAKALSPEKGVTVVNNIVPIHSNFEGSLGTAIVFPDIQQVVVQGAEDVVTVKETNDIRLISAAPFCGQYLGYECDTLLPDHCHKALHKGSKLMISGVVTNYGLDMRSIRCHTSHIEE